MSIYNLLLFSKIISKKKIVWGVFIYLNIHTYEYSWNVFGLAFTDTLIGPINATATFSACSSDCGSIVMFEIWITALNFLKRHNVFWNEIGKIKNIN